MLGVKLWLCYLCEGDPVQAQVSIFLTLCVHLVNRVESPIRKWVEECNMGHPRKTFHDHLVRYESCEYLLDPRVVHIQYVLTLNKIVLQPLVELPRVRHQLEL